jgi:glycosyl hydrolase family 26
LACIAILVLTTIVAGTGTGMRGARALPLTDLGVYEGAADPGAVAEFGRWLGREPSWALDFLQGTTWRTIARPRWFAERWADSPYRVVYSVPMLPSSGEATLRQGATGAYDDYFAQLARGLVAAGEGDAVIRLGWEFNGDWFPWSAAGREEAFVAFWRHAVDSMRSVDDGSFTFDWSPNAGPNAMDAADAYPGDDYVDYIGLDVYDATTSASQSPEARWDTLVNQPFGLAWHSEFAAAHGKPMTFPEWGLWLDDAGRGGGDDPYFIEQMWRWTALHDVVYQMYFDYDGTDGVAHELADPSFEQSGQRYRDLFGLVPVPLRPQP